MELNIAVLLDYSVSQPTDMLLQIEVADLPDQRVIAAATDLGAATDVSRVAAEAEIGERTWLRCENRLLIDYRATVSIERSAPDIDPLPAVALNDLPPETVRYLLPSLYCPEAKFQTFVAETFGALEGGARVAAIRDWVADHLSYVTGASDADTDAADTFLARQGICRDYAHLLIAMVRASAIPARYASVYAPNVVPPDFHAVAEVYLDGAWHLVDATGMASALDIARIGVGLDAAEVSFLTIFGNAGLTAQSVVVTSTP